MALNDPFELDPTSATSNSNYAGANIAENCAPSGINNALRALGSMLARATSYQSAAISASVSTNIAAASTGLFMAVTGPNAINSFGSVAGSQPSAAVLRILQFSSSASLSNGTSLVLRGGASRRTQPGDIGIYFHAGSGDTWHEVAYSSADGALEAQSVSITTITNRSMSTSAISTVTLNAGSISVTNQVFTNLNAVSMSTSVVNALAYKIGGLTTQQILQTSFTMTQTAASSSSSNIPVDTSTPLSSEGSLLFSVDFTPKNATSVLLFDISLMAGGATAGNDLVSALFKGTTNLAVGMGEAPSNGSTPLNWSYAESASNTTLRTYTLRFGSAATAMQINTNAAGDTMGGKLISSIKITELL
jgi:hypothetical protein